ncbi:hypothetical protein LSUE1_G002864 [Lachnellula suecica]|uniref:Uncharacterized protein n=1 Tax=Lachnellula suecica TaxID=602035 RepID=A0A8T9CB84_9HELO|nr:hypothetical protein LSUE1_G002864 [Lachnellula suecica]
MKRFKGVKSNTSVLTEDVEMQQPDQKRAYSGGETGDGHRITAVCDEYACAWTAAGIRNPRTAAECWPWFNAVCSAARSLKNEDISIVDVWDSISASASGNAKPGPISAENTACHVAIFSVLCWGTMTLRPRLEWADFKTSPSLMVYQQLSEQPGLKMDLVRRPIPAIFRHFQRTMPTGRWRHPISESHTLESTTLHVSSLNYASLKVIGKIRLVWVDNLSSHLDFDFANRRLSIFKFPSFCALGTLEDSFEPPVFLGLVRALYGADAGAKQDSENKAQIHQEVLMSYRLIFGQTRESRRLARAATKELKNQEPDSYDQLLDNLCGQTGSSMVRGLPLSLWPISCRTFEGSLQEENAYSSQDDFPMFGQRLAKLQEFNRRQRPSELRDLWRDRRDPLQWYTFWAVLIVGGSSLLLAVLQLGVGVIQVVAAYTPPPQPACRC